MVINQYDIWVADLNPRMGTEPGKRRPVLVVQTNLLNEQKHPSTLICPITTQLIDAPLLRVRLHADDTDLSSDSDVMIDQLRSIDNNRLIKKLGRISPEKIESVKNRLLLILDL